MFLQQAGIAGLRYLPIGIVIFFFILGFNLLGLFPFVLLCYFSFECDIKFGIVFEYFFVCFWDVKCTNLVFLSYLFRVEYLFFLMPLIVVIEVVSYLLRTISLSVRFVC